MLKEKHLLWAAIIALTIGMVTDNHRLRKDIERLENYQHQVNVMIYENVHKLANKSDSLWIYEPTDKTDTISQLD